MKFRHGKENYSSLVDVKLLLKRMLGGYSNKLVCKRIMEFKVQLAPPTKNVVMVVLTPKSVIQLTVFKAFKTGRKLNSVCCILFLVPLETCKQTEKKLGIVNWPIEHRKQYVFARQLPHTKTYIQFKYPPIKVHWTFLVGIWIWLWRFTDILLKGLLNDGDPRILLL